MITLFKCSAVIVTSLLFLALSEKLHRIQIEDLYTNDRKPKQ